METKHKFRYTFNNVQKINETRFLYSLNKYCYNICNCIIYYITYTTFTIIKFNVLTCFDNSKTTGALQPKVVHCDYTVRALRLCDWCIANRLGVFRPWGIQAEGHSDYNPLYLNTTILCICIKNHKRARNCI